MSLSQLLQCLKKTAQQQSPTYIFTRKSVHVIRSPILEQKCPSLCYNTPLQNKVPVSLLQHTTSKQTSSPQSFRKSRIATPHGRECTCPLCVLLSVQCPLQNVSQIPDALQHCAVLHDAELDAPCHTRAHHATYVIMLLHNTWNRNASGLYKSLQRRCHSGCHN